MKKSILILIVIFAISFSSFGQGEAKIMKYGFAYSLSGGKYWSTHKVMYVSSVVSGKVYTETGQLSSLSAQWNNKFSSEHSNSYEYDSRSLDYFDSKSDAEAQRKKYISDYENQGYTIKYVTNFYYKN